MKNKGYANFWEGCIMGNVEVAFDVVGAQRYQTRPQGRTLGTRLPAAHTQKKLNQVNTPRSKFQKPIPCGDKELITYFKFFLQNNALDLKFLFSPPLVNMVRSPIF